MLAASRQSAQTVIYIRSVSFDAISIALRMDSFQPFSLISLARMTVAPYFLRLRILPYGYADHGYRYGQSCGVHVWIVVKLIEWRASGVFIVAEDGVVVEMSVNVENTYAFRMTFCNLADDRIGNSMVSTEGDRERICLFNLADSLSDRRKGKRIITVSACDIAEITDF